MVVAMWWPGVGGEVMMIAAAAEERRPDESRVRVSAENEPRLRSRVPGELRRRQFDVRSRGRRHCDRR